MACTVVARCRSSLPVRPLATDATEALLSHCSTPAASFGAVSDRVYARVGAGGEGGAPVQAGRGVRWAWGGATGGSRAVKIRRAQAGLSQNQRRVRRRAHTVSPCQGIS